MDLKEKLRSIRENKKFDIVPSPYLKSTFIDEYGSEHKVELRQYQKIGIANMIYCPNFILGDDTGLGKTLQMLSTIGYIWMKEPEYKPIIITKKSSIYQWGSEVDKFMKGMRYFIADGKPVQRHKTYDEFFSFDGKAILIITYGSLLKDTNDGKVRTKSSSKGLSPLKKKLKSSKAKLESLKIVVDMKLEEMSPHERADMNYNIIRGLKSYDDTINEYIDTKLEVYGLEKSIKERKIKNSEVVSSSGILSRVTKDKKNKFMLIMDEIHTLKTHTGKMHNAAKSIAKHCDRVYGMTATPVQNRLLEFFSIYKIVNPSLFKYITAFRNNYCVMKPQYINGGRQIQVVVGYKRLDDFVDKIYPYYLSRRKYEVAEELPSLITTEVLCEMSADQHMLYNAAENEVKQTDDPDETNALSMLVALQQSADHPALLSNEEEDYSSSKSGKFDTLMDMLQNGLYDRKTIVFSRFKKMINLISEGLHDSDIKFVRVTGDEDTKQREAAKLSFQDKNSDVNVILITSAGAESINLQTADNFVFYDSPWSWGMYVQLIGRMIRIGSEHKTVTAHHLISVKKSGEKTIDDYVIKKLRKKKKLADRVAGEGIKDGLVFTSDKSENMELFESITK